MTDDPHTPPWLKGRRPPKGLNGWLQRKPLTTRGTTSAPPVDVPPESPPEVPRGPFRWREEPLEAITLVLEGHKAGRTVAQIAEDTGIPAAAARLFVSENCGSELHDHPRRRR